MSQYLNFYIKVPNEETYLPIGSFSRSNAVYRYGNKFAPYEAGTPITYDTPAQIREDIDYSIDEYKKDLEVLLGQHADIIKMNNSVEEKQEALHDIYCSQNEIKHEIEDLEYAKRYYSFIADIINSVEFDEKYDFNNYVYFGVEWCPDYNEEE